MEYGYGPEKHIIDEIKKSRVLIVVSSLILITVFVLFSIWGTSEIMDLDKKEFLVVNKKLNNITTEVESINLKQDQMQQSISNIESKMDSSIIISQSTNSKVSSLNGKVARVSENMDTIIVYIKK
jgi:outer membrane murein-binding lipoprotein Lpp